MYLAGKTAIHTTDGTHGYICNGYALDGIQWTQYEVVTEYGIEVWSTFDILVIA